jgi:hypothetical protein
VTSYWHHSRPLSRSCHCRPAPCCGLHTSLVRVAARKPAWRPWWLHSSWCCYCHALLAVHDDYSANHVDCDPTSETTITIKPVRRNKHVNHKVKNKQTSRQTSRSAVSRPVRGDLGLRSGSLSLALANASAGMRPLLVT